MQRPSRMLALALVAVAVAACGETEDGESMEPADAAMAASGAMLPDTTAAAIWQYLQSARYQETWALWPGKGRLYGGGEPHGMLLTTYANDVAHAGLNAGGPTGLMHHSIIVKENYMPDSTLAAVTVMYLVDGYNPDHGNWVFAKYQPDGTVDAFGRVPGCTTCHQAGSNYVLTPVAGAGM